jgi:hypothetical protein
LVSYTHIQKRASIGSFIWQWADEADVTAWKEAAPDAVSKLSEVVEVESPVIITLRVANTKCSVPLLAHSFGSGLMKQMLLHGKKLP